jgi:hypothetical protein
MIDYVLKPHRLRVRRQPCKSPWKERLSAVPRYRKPGSVGATPAAKLNQGLKIKVDQSYWYRSGICVSDSFRLMMCLPFSR